jgi:[NiFe] hydrogenase diaphorase moiety small subunit
MSTPGLFSFDGDEIPFQEGQTIIEAVLAAGRWIPHLCYHRDFPPHGSCRLCVVKVEGRFAPACTVGAQAGTSVESNIAELNDKRRTMLQLLFVEGNHFCPSCEKSGNCELQATAYELGMLSPHFDHFFPDRPVDASHPDILLDFNRCILCERCVHASRDVDGKSVFAIAGRGIGSHIVVNSESGRLADTDIALADRAVAVCPVGVILVKRRGFALPIGTRLYDKYPISKHQSAGE